MTTAQEFALTWHRMLFEPDMAMTWRLMTPDFRRVVAQTALGGARALGHRVNAEAETLAEESPVAEDLQVFFAAAWAIMQRACVVPPEAVGAGVTTRIEAPAFEVVRLYVLEDLSVDGEGNRHLPPGESAWALTLIVAADAGTWAMAGIGRVMAPGWPPAVDWDPSSEI